MQYPRTSQDSNLINLLPFKIVGASILFLISIHIINVGIESLYANSESLIDALLAVILVVILAVGVIANITVPISAVMLIGLGFRESFMWGLVVLFMPFGGLIFAIGHWDKAKATFLTHLVSMLVALIFGIAICLGYSPK